MEPKQKLNVVGAGRVGATLARLWHDQRVFEIQQVCNQTPQSSRRSVEQIGAGRPAAALEDFAAAGVWMLAVPDAAIATVAQAIGNAHAQQPGGMTTTTTPTIFHCSGAQSSAALAPLKNAGWSVASVHCILSFATVGAALEQFPGTACALEGDAAALTLLRPALQAIGATCFEVAAADKLLYHAAAVFATNFMPALQSLAEAAWHDTGVPRAVIEQLRATLLRNAADNISHLGPARALTGPAARGDIQAIERQSQAVRAWSHEAGDVYDALSTVALQLARSAPDPQSLTQPQNPADGKRR